LPRRTRVRKQLPPTWTQINRPPRREHRRRRLAVIKELLLPEATRAPAAIWTSARSRLTLPRVWPPKRSTSASRRSLRGAAAVLHQGAALRDSAVFRDHAERPVRQPRRARPLAELLHHAGARGRPKRKLVRVPQPGLGLQLSKPSRGANCSSAE